MIDTRSLFKLISIILIKFAVLTDSAYARWATYDDADLKTEFYNENLIINKDGTTEAVIEIQEQILKESARSYATNYKFIYDGVSSDITLIEAKTINNGQEFPVTKDRIEDKTLASIGHGFDEQRQLLISYPNIGIGSKIYLKYKYTVKKPALSGVFSKLLYFGMGSYCQSAKITVSSELPLHIMVNDSDSSLNIVKNKEDNFQKLNITLKKPLYKAVTDEPCSGVLDSKHLVWISLSSLGSWEELAHKVDTDYDKVISQPLPKLFSDIAKAAEEVNGGKDKIDTVTSLLSEKIQYMGDWRAIKGRFIPRDLNEIASTGVGDCKDFTAATIAILRSIGYKADPALVLNMEKPIYEVIPAIDFKHSVIEENETLSVKNNYSAVNYKGNIALKGEMANYVTGLDLYYSKQQMEDFAFRMISGIELEKDERKNLVLPQLSSRIVKNVKVEYEYERKNALFKTNVSYALTMGSAPEVSSIINSPPDRVTDLLMGAPHINTKKTLIKNAKAKRINKLNYSIDSPWIKVTRTLVNKGRDVEINDETLVLRSFITKEDLETLLFKNLKTSLAKDLQKASIVFE
jgi:Domain of Unknown Function with PDB structure (DUF3857)